MFTQAVLPDTIRAIKLISKLPSIQKAYLAGGSALALHIGHRISVDLDFFTQEEIDENKVSLELSSIGQFKEEGKSWRTVWGSVVDTKFSIFYYPYPLLEKTSAFEGIQMVGKKDIAAMKIHALEDRGTKRDFIDAFFLAKVFTLEKMLTFYDQKYGSLHDHVYTILRSLDYFADADSDERPLKMLMDVSWDDVKQFFKQESIRLAKERLGVEE